MKWTFYGGIFGIGMLVGFGLAVSSVRTELEVDYDSGMVQEVVSIGPIKVREADYGQGYFGSIFMPNGHTAVSGVPNWQLARSFKGNSRRSPLLEAGQVLNDIHKLEQLPWNDSGLRLSVVKQEFLESLVKGGVHAASETARVAEKEVLAASETRSKNK